MSAGKADFFKKYKMDFVMGRREGPWLYDIEGEKRLFNCHVNGGVFNLGHRHESIVEALKSALTELDIGNHHLMSRERAELGRILAESMPGDLNVCIFGVGGGEAVDLALKVALGYTGRSRIISAQGGYHGHTGLALTAGDARYRDPFGIQAANTIQLPFNDIPALRATLDDTIAAVILETIPATLGMVIPQKGYLEKVRDLCSQNGSLLIMDEVQSGLGRTGKLWAFEHAGIVPDMVVIGKGLSGGMYPITATVMREPLDAVFKKDPFIHISTFGGSEIGCRVAKRVLELSGAPEFLARVRATGESLREGLLGIQKKYPKFFNGLRQSGLMIGMELRDELAGPALTKAAYDNDLLLIYANNDPSIVQFLVPLTISDEEISWVLRQLEKAVRDARKLRVALLAKTGVDSLTSRIPKRGKDA